MPIKHRIDAQNRRLAIKIDGEFSNREMLSCTALALRDPQLGADFNVLTDHRGVTRVIDPLQVQKVMALFETEQSSLAGRSWAIISGKSDLQYGMLRVLAGQAESLGLDIAIFEAESDALDWLDGRSSS